VTSTPVFAQLNHGWNADPNVPEPQVRVDGSDVVLSFRPNSMLFPIFKFRDVAILRFTACSKYRLGSTNDEGWYRGQCRYSKLAPGWGEFYRISDEDPALANRPADWHLVDASPQDRQHFLFYFRDDTFECMASGYVFDRDASNALLKLASE
jgi:hypothetical protein